MLYVSLFFIHGWTLRFFPCLGSRESHGREPGAVDIFSRQILLPLGKFPKVELLDQWRFSLLFFEDPLDSFPAW